MPEIARTPDGCLQAGTGASWEHFHHVADVGIRGIGPTLGSAFEQAAKAMTAAVTDPDSIKPEETIEIGCHAPNLELLLVDWLNAVVYEMATRKMLFGRFRVHIHRNRLSGKISGEPINVERHAPATEVKGVTLSELEVTRGSDGRWRAQCIVDV
jgi:tRNA nucleotidyltransferase (CCA-adding enzyme)